MLLPKPYPDELVGSVIARACFQTGLAPKTLMHSIRGTRQSGFPFLMAPNLNDLAARCGLDAEELLWNHTVFPYTVAFMPQATRDNCRDKLLAPRMDGETVRTTTKNVSHGVPYRRLCMRCVAEDLRNHGESYWRRAHMLPGALLCADHQEVLHVTAAPLRGATQGSDARLPHQVPGTPPRYDRPMEMYAGVTSRSVLLLHRKPTAEPSLEVLRGYRIKAHDRGFTLKSGHLASGVMAAELHRRYGGEYIADAGCPFCPSKASAWPRLMVREASSSLFATVKHVLMEDFLTGERRLLLSMTACYSPPGKKPRDYQALDASTAKRLKKLHQGLQRRGERRSVRDLLSELGVWSSFRHDRALFPETHAVVKEFRSSEQSVMQVGRRKRTYRRSSAA